MISLRYEKRNFDFRLDLFDRAAEHPVLKLAAAAQPFGEISELDDERRSGVHLPGHRIEQQRGEFGRGFRVIDDLRPVARVFFPDETSCLEKDQIKGRKIMLFLHGGGWATEHVENYERVCSRMAQATGQTVAAVEYRLAPEHKFPTGLMDCYAVARALYTHPDTKPEDITLIGDSAGGNLAAALSIMARDRGEFMPKRQILIYPAVNNDYSEKSLFSSVRENGQDYLLTAGKLKDYINLYAGSEEDKLNPYFAPILEKDLSGQPDTLILTSEFDPLRDEGEAYGRRLAEAGNRVEVHRIKDALHGYFALGIRSLHVQESFEYINHFLEGE